MSEPDVQKKNYSQPDPKKKIKDNLIWCRTLFNDYEVSAYSEILLHFNIKKYIDMSIFQYKRWNYYYQYNCRCLFLTASKDELISFYLGSAWSISNSGWNMLGSDWVAGQWKLFCQFRSYCRLMEFFLWVDFKWNFQVKVRYNTTCAEL